MVDAPEESAWRRHGVSASRPRACRHDESENITATPRMLALAPPACDLISVLPLGCGGKRTAAAVPVPGSSAAALRAVNARSRQPVGRQPIGSTAHQDEPDNRTPDGGRGGMSDALRGCMLLRTFVSADGKRWSVWRVEPDGLGGRPRALFAWLASSTSTVRSAGVCSKSRTTGTRCRRSGWTCCAGSPSRHAAEARCGFPSASSIAPCSGPRARRATHVRRRPRHHLAGLGGAPLAVERRRMRERGAAPRSGANSSSRTPGARSSQRTRHCATAGWRSGVTPSIAGARRSRTGGPR